VELFLRDSGTNRTGRPVVYGQTVALASGNCDCRDWSEADADRFAAAYRMCGAALLAQFGIFTETKLRVRNRHGIHNPEDAHDWKMTEKARTFYKTAATAELVVPIFEASQY
jgi:hypothetical protein